MGRAKKVRKIKKQSLLKRTDARLKESVKAIREAEKPKKKELLETEKKKNDAIVYREQESTALFFSYNKSLGPPYQIIMDTNFINFSIQHKLDIFKGLMDLLYAKVIPIVTDCIIGELEKMGHRFRLALRIAKDPRVHRLTCDHKGTYADDCIINRITDHRCYIVGTSDKDLKNRIRKVPGVPIVTVTQHKYAIERLPDTVMK